MKKLAAILITACCFFASVTAYASMILEYDGGVHNYTGSVYSLTVNGTKLSKLPLEPIIFNDRAVVPVREVFEALGATVDYEAKNKTIDIKYDKTTVELQIDSNSAYVNGKMLRIPDGVTPKLIAKWGESAKTMVPVRFISEQVGLKVDFDAKGGNISVSNGSTPQTKPAVQNTITKIETEEKGNTVTVKVTAKNKFGNITSAAVTNSGTLYVDVTNTTYTTSNKITVSEDGIVKSVRLGLHDKDVRIAIDTNGMKKHSESVEENVLTFVITADDKYVPPKKPEAPSDGQTETPTQTQGVQRNKDGVPLIDGKTPSEISKNVKYVVLDAGHGGSDLGAVGFFMTKDELEEYHEAKNVVKKTETVKEAEKTENTAKSEETEATEEKPKTVEELEHGSGGKVNEKDVALQIVKKIKTILEDSGVKVILTRSGDTYPTLDERTEIANEQGAAMFLSVHLNATVNQVTTANGMEIYYCSTNNDDVYGVKSEDMASTILKKAIKETGAYSRGVKTGNLLVTRKTVMPANLIEVGFINNPEEIVKLTSDSYQNKIASGIANGILEVYGKIDLP